MSEPFTKFRFSAHFSVPLGAGGTATQRFAGTLSSVEGSDLIALVVGTLVDIAKRENLSDVRSLKITASAVRSRKKS